MPRWVTVSLALLAGGSQYVNLFTAVIPEKYKGTVTGGIGLASVGLVALAHSYNPDGTPATQAYIPPMPTPQTPPKS